MEKQKNPLHHETYNFDDKLFGRQSDTEKKGSGYKEKQLLYMQWADG